jgi:fatty acid desaturase
MTVAVNCNHSSNKFVLYQVARGPHPWGMFSNGITKIQRYRFSPAIREQLRPLHRLDNWHGLLAWVEDVAWIAGSIQVAEHALAFNLFWPAYLLVTFPVVAARQRALATLLHESAHGTLAKNKKLNRFIGTYLSGYMILQSYSAYFASHVRDHHGHFGDPTRDPDLRDHIGAGLYAPCSNRHFVLRHLLRPLLTSQFTQVRRLAATRLTYGADRSELARLASFVTLLTCVACYEFGVANTALYWFAPLVFGFPVVNWYIELLEHFPYPVSAQFDVEASRHRAVGPISRHFFGVHNEGYHLDHHLTPGIPFWNLPKARKIRAQDPFFANIMIESEAGIRSNLWRQFASLVTDRPSPVPRCYQELSSVK